MPAKLAKIAMTATVALFLTLVAFGNVTDYGSNFEFVRHVLSMDTTFPDSNLRWRRIESPVLYHLAYWIIIAWEAAAAVACWIGAWRLWRARGAGFDVAKGWAVGGLAGGFLLFALGFITIGGEWFAMWQSEVWNGQISAGLFMTMSGLTLIFVATRDAEA